MEEPLSIENTTETLDHGKSRIGGYFTVTIKYDTEGHYLGVETEEATPAPRQGTPTARRTEGNPQCGRAHFRGTPQGEREILRTPIQ